MSQVIDATSFNDIHCVVDGSIIRVRLKLRRLLSPAVMSGLSGDAGRAFGSVDDFFSLKIKRWGDPFTVLGLRSVSSYSRMDGWSE